VGADAAASSGLSAGARLAAAAGGQQAAEAGRGEGRLGVWCTHQRRRQKGSKGPPLSAAQAVALEAIPGWRRRAACAIGAIGHRCPGSSGGWRLWLSMSSTAGGRARLVASPLLRGEKELGNWCRRQRQRCKGTKKPSLTPEQVAALEELVLGGVAAGAVGGLLPAGCGLLAAARHEQQLKINSLGKGTRY
jgi:hypothetical protein